MDHQLFRFGDWVPEPYDPTRTWNCIKLKNNRAVEDLLDEMLVYFEIQDDDTYLVWGWDPRCEEELLHHKTIIETKYGPA